VADGSARDEVALAHQSIGGVAGYALGRKGLRPRDAAYLIAALWTIAVVLFGVLDQLTDELQALRTELKQARAEDLS
jgi:hypothetical protein